MTRLLLNSIMALVISLSIAMVIAFQIMPRHIAMQVRDDVQQIVQTIEKEQLSEEVFQNALYQFSLTNIRYRTLSELQKADYLSEESKTQLENNQSVEGDDTSKELLYVYPVTINGEKRFLELTLRQTIYQGILKGAFISLAFITLFVGIILNVFTSLQIVRPIRKLTNYTQQFAKGNFSFTKAKKSANEINQLYESFETMSYDLGKMIQSQKDFVSNISHEFQTPLTSINGFSKALQQKEMSREKQLDYLKIIETESARLSQLSRNVLKLSSLQNDIQPLESRTFDLAEQIRQVIISLEPHWTKKQLHFDLQLSRSLITADEMLLYQVWYNLINNAIQFTKTDGCLHLFIETQQNHYRITLEDEGPGIDEYELIRVKEPFYKSKKNPSSGNGLGLSIVENIIQKHDGLFELENYSNGLRIIITLPK